MVPSTITWTNIAFHPPFYGSSKRGTLLPAPLPKRQHQASSNQQQSPRTNTTKSISPVHAPIQRRLQRHGHKHTLPLLIQIHLFFAYRRAHSTYEIISIEYKCMGALLTTHIFKCECTRYTHTRAHNSGKTIANALLPMPTNV